MVKDYMENEEEQIQKRGHEREKRYWKDFERRHRSDLGKKKKLEEERG